MVSGYDLGFCLCLRLLEGFRSTNETRYEGNRNYLMRFVVRKLQSGFGRSIL